MKDKENKTYKNWLAEFSTSEPSSSEATQTIKSYLKKKADFISFIMDELFNQEEETYKKHYWPYPKYIKDLSEKDIDKLFTELISGKKAPTTVFEILEQLAAIHRFYITYSKSKNPPPLRMLMEVEILAQRAIYYCGLASINPYLVKKHLRLEESKSKTKIKKEIWAGIILKAAKRKKISPGKIPRVKQLRIYQEIDKMIDEGVLSDKELSSLNDKKPPSIDTIKARMLEAANSKNKKT